MGTMRERTPGTWELTVSAGRDHSTGRYRRVIRTIRTTSKRQAKLALSELEAAVASGRVTTEDRSLAELLDSWMEHIAQLGRADTTLHNYRLVIDRDIKPTLGTLRLSKLTALDIDRLYTRLRKRSLAPATIRQVHAIIRAALHQAERWGLVDRNVARLASAPSQPQREQHPPTLSDVQALLAGAAAVSPLFGLYIRVMVATGARRSEVCALKWFDVDGHDGTVRVERSYLAIATGRGDRPTKTRSARTVRLDSETLEQLERAWTEAEEMASTFGVSAEIRRCGYIFSTDPDGAQPWRPDTANYWWTKARRAADLTTNYRMHDLRHFQATLLLDAGIPVPTVAARLGHSDGTTTMKIYAHRTQRADAEAAAVVGKSLAPDNSA